PAASAPSPKPTAADPAPQAPAPSPKAAAPKAAPAAESGETIVAPMPGMMIKYEKQIGDHVKLGETVLVLEAMKMYNNIPSPVEGTLVATPLSAGANVSKGDVMAVIQVG
ncbi:MAG: acetyl-CoA carboxylase biotin carboxyl carrier protein subunit, partial [Candidatus Cloacimonetes bacterium]|nr:acetyl-CoA carboxylase biotin carboxyl carrier protein subunit [Candidatus Cloacimonadota bacterium]